MAKATRDCPFWGLKMLRDYGTCPHCTRDSEPPKISLLEKIVMGILTH